MGHNEKIKCFTLRCFEVFKKLHSSTALNLPCTLSEQLIRCLIPNEKLSGDVVQSFTLWILTNCRRLSIKHCLEPGLRWINGVLHYNICSVKDLQCLYEAFFQLLGLSSVVSDFDYTMIVSYVVFVFSVLWYWIFSSN